MRARLAALGRRTAQNLRHLDFPPLAEKLRNLLPPELLASEDEALTTSPGTPMPGAAPATRMPADEALAESHRISKD